MDESMLANGFIELNTLAETEYMEQLSAVLAEPDSEKAAIRIGRLVGVLLKEPFAIPYSLSGPSNRTGAYRAWHLVDPIQFSTFDRTNTWQHQALVQMRQELIQEEPYLAQMTDYKFAEYANNEVGFFGFFARTLRKYICGDPEIRKKVEAALKGAARAEKNIRSLTPEMIVGTGGLSLGVFLVQSIPILGIVGAPVIAAVVVILYTLGVNAFCEWSKRLRTDEDEKH